MIQPTLTALTRLTGPLAQWHPGPYGPHHGPMGGGGMWGSGPVGGAGMGGFGLLGGWLLVALLVVLLGAVAAYVLLEARADGDGGGADPALATLRERYAAGDLTDDEFERRRSRLVPDR